MGVPAAIGITSYQMNENFLLSFFPPHLKQNRENEPSEPDMTENEAVGEQSMRRRGNTMDTKTLN